MKLHSRTCVKLLISYLIILILLIISGGDIKAQTSDTSFTFTESEVLKLDSLVQSQEQTIKIQNEKILILESQIFNYKLLHEQDSLHIGLLNQKPIIGLPGNPVSSYICALIFLSAAINKMLGSKDNLIKEKIGILGSKLNKNDDREDYIRAKLIRKKIDEPIIIPYKQQDSSMLSLLSKSDCVIKRPPFAEKADIGEQIKYIELP